MLMPNQPAPALSVPLLQGGTWTLAERRPERFTIVVFYRGKHCPICRDYLQSIEAQIDDIAAAGINILAVSMDSAERARTAAEDWGISRLPLGFDMSEATAREWGLYISSQRPGSQEPARFSEPGTMVIRPDGTMFFMAVQSAPFTRPAIDALLRGLDFAARNDYPARGDLTAAAA
ncbi:peroxiredoxin-like family protein [Paralimibaculum aggregatum]|uniref:Peroxiredoxin-like family protein n=1 Tax=Paralimibaculum aggregatum TaxID=3036245 RepID=A0ABQ6LJQ9_9RHOB|nr:peroxiredoxin-like family protein [Limibaculum sp. NKW23]GMG81448.1 peroxiredoxin-like family protein [Limibaculum sp. NKW23]